MSAGPDDKGTATIKFGKEFDAPWYVAYGHPSEIRRQIIQAFGYESVDDSVTLIDLMAKASADAQAAFALAKGGGASPDPWGATGGRRAGGSGKAAAGKKSEPETPADPANENQPIVDAIKAAADETELKKVWAENSDAFSDKELQTAYKAKLKELKGK